MNGWLILLAFIRLTTPAAEADDAELLAHAFDYDAQALGAIYDRYEVRIYTYIFRRIGDQTMAEDLTGQVFLKMLEAIRNRKAWHSSFSGWLYRIAHNVVIDFYRQRDHQQHVSLEDEPTLPALDDNPVEAAELKL